MANLRCLVIHTDGICPGPYGKCTCDDSPSPVEKKEDCACHEPHISSKVIHTKERCYLAPQTPLPESSWEKEFDRLFSNDHSGKNSLGLEYIDAPISKLKSFIRILLTKKEEEKKCCPDMDKPPKRKFRTCACLCHRHEVMTALTQPLPQRIEEMVREFEEKFGFDEKGDYNAALCRHLRSALTQIATEAREQGLALGEHCGAAVSEDGVIRCANIKQKCVAHSERENARKLQISDLKDHHEEELAQARAEERREIITMIEFKLIKYITDGNCRQALTALINQIKETK